tara:strand:- start:2139 stop:3233 length:1095 start_codon:yes stop_codon:yes gene_type:complete
MNAEAPVGTTLAILERSMKVMSAVQARLHASMKKELRILSGIVRDFGPTEYPYSIPGGELLPEDFDDKVDIIPVSDPNAGTMAQRIMQYQAALQLAVQAPQMYDMPLLHRQMLEVLGIRDAEKIVPLEDEVEIADPVTENMNIINGEPVKAFIYQDHEAHIQTHTALIQDPKIIEIMSQSPTAQSAQAAMAAHISEHVAFAYRAKIEEELGVPLPGPNEPLPEDIELRLSRLVAPAAAQLTGKDQREAQMQEQMEQAEDPIIQMQQQELQIKQQQAQAKAQSDMAKIQLDLQKAMDKSALEREKLSQQDRLDRAKLGVRIAEDNSREQLESKRIASKEQLEGAKLGKEIAKDLMDDQNSKGKPS